MLNLWMPGGRTGAIIILVASIILVVVGILILLAPAGDSAPGHYEMPFGAWLAVALLVR